MTNKTPKKMSNNSNFPEYVYHPSGNIDVKFHKKLQTFPRKWRFTFVDYDNSETPLLAILNRSGNVIDVVYRDGDNKGHRAVKFFEKYYGWSYKSF